MKHVGMIANTGKRCVVVFREVYDERGKVIEPDNCLVVETDTLPDHAHQDIVSIVQSEPAQRTGNLYEVLARTRMTEGSIALAWLHNNNRLVKHSTSNVYMVPDSSTKVRLDKINRIIALQKSGHSQEQIENMMRDSTDAPPVFKETITADNVEEFVSTVQETATPVVSEVNSIELSNQLLEQANKLMEQADLMRTRAQQLLEPNDASAVKKTVGAKKATKKEVI